jgi:methyl-accepting chemotaxis protein
MTSQARGHQSPSNRAVVKTGRSLKTVLLSIMGCLAIIAIASLGYQAIGSSNHYRSAVAVDEANAAGNRLVAGIYQVLLERLLTNNALQADAPVTVDGRNQIAERRKTAEAEMGVGLPVILASDFPEKATLTKALKTAAEKAADLRRRADDAIGRDKSERDASLLQNFVPAMTEYVNASLAVWTASLYGVKAEDPAIARYATLKRLGWLMREVSGFERALISTAIANGKPIAPERLSQIAGYRAQVALAWKLVQDLTADPGTPQEITQAIAGAKERYFGGFEPLSDKMQKLSREGAAYPMTAAEWVKTTNPQIDSLLEIMYATGHASEALTAKLATAALTTLILELVGIALAVGVALACLFVVIRRVTAPLERIGRTVRTLAGGDLQIDVTETERDDEIGEVARSVEVFKQNALAAVRLESEQRAAQAQKQERQKALESYILDFDHAMHEALEALASASTEMRATAGSLSSTAKETQRQAGAVASASEQTSANVQTVAASAEEMTSSIAEIGRQVARSLNIAQQAVENAQRTNGTVNTLGEAAQKIGQVMQLIQEIASQTNLLALNATIEAARAGEAGKGFAVVASEVKSLANQTAKATEEIGAQIAAMQSATGEAVSAIQAIGGIIGQINEISTTIASAIEEQGAATEEIARTTQQAAKSTEQVSSNIAGVNSAVGETGAASVQVLASAEQLSRRSETLRADISSFLEKVRAA